METTGNSMNHFSKKDLLGAIDKCCLHEQELYYFRQGFLNLIQRLSRYNLDEYVEEIVYSVWQPGITAFKGIKGWTVEMVKDWVKTLTFLEESTANKLESECIDGDCFMALTDKHWIEQFGLDYSTFYLLDTIYDGWKSKSREFYVRHRPSEGVFPIGVLMGTCADLSEIADPSLVQALVDADNECTANGAGYIYGQIVILGYKEYRIVEQNWCPFGSTNQKLVLKRRRVPNGITPVKALTLSSATSQFFELRGKIRFSLQFAQKEIIESKISLTGGTDDLGAFSYDNSSYELDYKTDPTMDMYQIGRSLSGNDFIVTGMLHVDESGCTAGPLSRFACRVYCERLPPFRSFIFAGAFDTDKGLNVAKTILRSNASGNVMSTIDGFTTYGIRIWQPEIRQWLEVSIMGNTFEPRALNGGQNGPEVFTFLGNQLTEGSMIDLGGVTLLFQGPVHMAATIATVNPQRTIGSLNLLKPLCPVLFNEIKFSYLDSQERQMRSLRRNAADNKFVVYLPTSSYHVPTTDYFDVNEENRSYVFPVCGHVYGYHKSLEDRPCPLCRKAGPFVPIAFTFEPSICSRKPTHVFNPCGHVASKRTCEYWARTPVFNRSMNTPGFCRICPFCATELAGSANLTGDEVPAEAFSKLILQTETGLEWDSDASDDAIGACIVEEEIGIGATASLCAIIESQQKLFYRERVVGNTRLSKNEEYGLHMDHMSRDRLIHPKFPKYVKGYTIFGEKISN